MLLVIIGKCHRHQYQNRQNIHQNDTDCRQGKQRNMKFFVKQRLHIFLKGIDVLPVFFLNLQAVNRFHVCDPEQNKYKNKEQCHNGIQQNQKRIIIIIDRAGHGQRVKHLLKLHCAERSKLSKVWSRIADAQHGKQRFHQKHDNTIHYLFSRKITRAHQNRRQLNPHISPDKGNSNIFKIITYRI